jgi:hypothetical protein
VSFPRVFQVCVPIAGPNAKSQEPVNPARQSHTTGCQAAVQLLTHFKQISMLEKKCVQKDVASRFISAAFSLSLSVWRSLSVCICTHLNVYISVYVCQEKKHTQVLAVLFFSSGCDCG